MFIYFIYLREWVDTLCPSHCRPIKFVKLIWLVRSTSLSKRQWVGAINRYTHHTRNTLLPQKGTVTEHHLVVIKTRVKSHSCSHAACKALSLTELKLNTRSMPSTTHTNTNVIVKERHLLDSIPVTRKRRSRDTCWYVRTLYCRL